MVPRYADLVCQSVQKKQHYPLQQQTVIHTAPGYVAGHRLSRSSIERKTNGQQISFPFLSACEEIVENEFPKLIQEFSTHFILHIFYF
jgi:hypothetical protein